MIKKYSPKLRKKWRKANPVRSTKDLLIEVLLGVIAIIIILVVGNK